MSGTRGRIDPTEFKETDVITKGICFLVISPLIVAFIRTQIPVDIPISMVLTIFMYIIGTILGVLCGFIGSYLGKIIQENVGSVAVYEKGVMDIFLRKVGMKIGPSLTGCAVGALIGSFGLVKIFH